MIKSKKPHVTVGTGNRLDMDKTKVLIVLPKTVRNRLSEDLDIREAVPDEQRAEYQPYFEAMDHYEFYIAGWIDQPRSKMLALTKDIRRRWPDISYAVYLNPNSTEGSFYENHKVTDKNVVGVEEFIAELDRQGMPSTPVDMDYEDFFGEITIRPRYRDAIEVFTAVPRVLYRAGKLVLPSANIWLLENEQEIFRYLAQKPEKVFDMSPREFEMLVASVFRANGFDVELTPGSRDGGFDVLAVQRSKFVGETRFLIECKRYAKENKVGIGLVQRLIGTVNQFKATRGILVTTSSFTRDAVDCVESTPGIITIKDYECLTGWLKDLDFLSNISDRFIN